MNATLGYSGLAGAIAFDRLTRPNLDDVETDNAEISNLRLLTSTAVATVAAPVLTVASCFAKVVQPAVNPIYNITPVRLLYAPVCGDVYDDHKKRRDAYMERLERSRNTRGTPLEVCIRHPRGTLHAVYTRSAHDRGARRVALLVGGNSQSLECMEREAWFLLALGIDVFAFQPSGFPCPEESYQYEADESLARWLLRKSLYSIDESSIMMDVCSSIAWLKREIASKSGDYCDIKFREDEIMVEGHSLGTLSAHMAARMYPDLRAIAVIEPLTSISDVSTYAVLNKLGDIFEHWIHRSTLYKMLYSPVQRCASVVSKLAFSPDMSSKVPEDIHGFDVHHAVENFKGYYCAIQAERDELMSLKYDSQASKPGSRNFASKLVSIAKKRRMSRRRARLITDEENWHGCAYLSKRHVKNSYVGFLADAGMANLS